MSSIMQPPCSSGWSPSALWQQHEPLWWGCPMAPLVQVLVQLGWEPSLVTWSAPRDVSSRPRHCWDGPQKLSTEKWLEYGSQGCPEKDWMVRGERGRAPWSSPAAEACLEIVVPRVERLPCCPRGHSFRSSHSEVATLNLQIPVGFLPMCLWKHASCVSPRQAECKRTHTNSPNSSPTYTGIVLAI